MVRALSRRMRALFGAGRPNAWTPPAMLAFTAATYAAAFGLVFLFCIVVGPSPWLKSCLTAQTVGGATVLTWITVANLGWAAVLVTDGVLKLVARRSTAEDRIRSSVLAVMGLLIVVGMQVAVEALRIVASPVE